MNWTDTITYGFAPSVSKLGLPHVHLHQIILVTLLFSCAAMAASATPNSAEAARANFVQTDKTEQAPEGKTPSYIDKPLENLTRDVPELQTLQPAADQQELAMILQNTGERVDEFFRNLVDLIADEQIAQQGQEWHKEATQEVQDSYLIVLHGNDIESRLEEYRTDAEGNRLGQVGPDRFYFVNLVLRPARNISLRPSSSSQTSVISARMWLTRGKPTLWRLPGRRKKARSLSRTLERGEASTC